MSSLLLGVVLALSVAVGLHALRNQRGITPGVFIGAVAVFAALCVASTVVLAVFADLNLFGVAHMMYLAGVIGVPVVASMLFLVATARGTTRTTQVILAAAAVLPAVVGLYGTHIEPERLRVDQHTLLLPRPAGGIRVGVLADLQSGTVGEYEKGAVQTLLDQNPDLIVVPGDLYQMPAEEFQQRWPQFAELLQTITSRVPHVFIVEGDADNVEGLALISGSGGGTVLHNTIKTIEIRGQKVVIAGVGLRGEAGTYEQAALSQLSSTPSDAVRLLVSHHPDVSLVHPDADLVISGHTHGGQIAVPGFGPLITLTDVPRNVASGGLHDLDGTNVYVSTGVGLERGQAPQVRLFVRPSVGVIDIAGTN